MSTAILFRPIGVVNAQMSIPTSRWAATSGQRAQSRAVVGRWEEPDCWER
jgi:hypothetical protein